MKRFYRSVARAAAGMSEDQASMMAAALAYYAVFSIAPLLIIALGAIGLLAGPSTGERVFGLVSKAVGPQGASAVRSMVQSASSRPHAGLIATVVGVVTLFFGASGVFTQLQQSLDNIWRVTMRPSAGWSGYVRQRLLAFGAVIALGPLLLLSMAASTGLSAAGDALPGGRLPWAIVSYAVSIAILGGLFAGLFKVLPDVRLSWNDAAPGGLLTALLFVAGNAAIGAYLSRSGAASSYGAAGSLIVVLLWVYYSSQIILFGAEFTRAWALHGGRAVEPAAGAVRRVPVTSAEASAERQTPHERRGRERAAAGR